MNEMNKQILTPFAAGGLSVIFLVIFIGLQFAFADAIPYDNLRRDELLWDTATLMGFIGFGSLAIYRKIKAKKQDEK